MRQQEALGIREAAGGRGDHDLPSVVDAEGEGGPGAGGVERRVDPLAQQEAVEGLGIGGRVGGITVEIAANDLAAIVDVGADAPAPSGPSIVVNRPFSHRIPVEPAVGVEVLAHHLTAVVDAEGLRLHGAGDMDRGELAALVAAESRACQSARPVFESVSL